MMDNLFWIGFVGAAIAIAFAWLQSRRVMTFSEGSDKMAKIAASIREGANAYLKHQYTTVAKVFLVVFLVLQVMTEVRVSVKGKSFRATTREAPRVIMA